MEAIKESEYDEQAEGFLTRFGLTFKPTLKGDRCPPWDDGKHIHGHRYRVTIKRGKDSPCICDDENRSPSECSRHSGGKSLSFDFWNSLNDVQTRRGLTAYSVLAALSSDAYCPDNFEDFCSEYGYEQDSRKAFSTFKRASRFSDQIKAFFTEDELEALSEIS
jgi:hypothetical protein